MKKAIAASVLLLSSAFVLAGCDNRNDLRDCLLAKKTYLEAAAKYRETQGGTSEMWFELTKLAASLEDSACPKKLR